MHAYAVGEGRALESALTRTSAGVREVSLIALDHLAFFQPPDGIDLYTVGKYTL